MLPLLRLRAWLRLARGRGVGDALVQRAARFLAKPFVHGESRLYVTELRVLLALEAGDAAGAVAAARPVLDDDPAMVRWPRYGWALLAAAARAGGALAPRVTELAARLPRRYPAEIAHAAQVAALLEGGRQRWRAAVEAWRADGHPYELATALLGLAEAQAADRSAAAETLTELMPIADALGAVPLLTAADTLARRLGIRAPGAVAAGTEILTAREREVLRLVSEGHSNSRIASLLYISPKTASVHVSRILAKLEVANRVEAAAVAHRLGLMSD